jgi:hypothetical protein
MSTYPLAPARRGNRRRNALIALGAVGGLVLLVLAHLVFPPGG